MLLPHGMPVVVLAPSAIKWECYCWLPYRTFHWASHILAGYHRPLLGEISLRKGTMTLLVVQRRYARDRDDARQIAELRAFAWTGLQKTVRRTVSGFVDQLPILSCRAS